MGAHVVRNGVIDLTSAPVPEPLRISVGTNRTVHCFVIVEYVGRAAVTTERVFHLNLLTHCHKELSIYATAHGPFRMEPLAHRGLELMVLRVEVRIRVFVYVHKKVVCEVHRVRRIYPCATKKIGVEDL